jgi:hypothetical protein
MVRVRVRVRVRGFGVRVRVRVRGFRVRVKFRVRVRAVGLKSQRCLVTPYHTDVAMYTTCHIYMSRVNQLEYCHIGCHVCCHL